MFLHGESGDLLDGFVLVDLAHKDLPGLGVGLAVFLTHLGEWLAVEIADVCNVCGV